MSRDQSQDGPDGQGLPLGWFLGDKQHGLNPAIKPPNGGRGRAVREMKWAAHVSQVLSAEPSGWFIKEVGGCEGIYSEKTLL